MGSSAKKKREKKRDFQKAKLKVGKTKQKAANHTETSFKSKAIVLNHQSLTVTTPSTSSQFGHHVSLLTSKSDSQRRESLAYLTSFMTSRPIGSPIPQPVSTLLPNLFPLILDGSSNVRIQLLKLFRALPPGAVEDHVIDILPYVRAGMTHLAAEIRLSAVDVLCWLLEDAGLEVVSCAGGWYKTLNCFLAILGWSSHDSIKWSSQRASFGKSGSEGRPMSKILQALAEFVHAGLDQAVVDASTLGDATLHRSFPMQHSFQHQRSQKSNAFGYLNLFGVPRDDETEMLEDREDRQRVFDSQDDQHFFKKPTDHSDYSDFEQYERDNTFAANMTLKDLSMKLTDQYEAITKLIPGRPNAAKWETTMAALAQVYVFLYPGEIGLPNELIYPAITGTGAQQAENAARDTFNQDSSYVLNQSVINHLEAVWEFWDQSIAHARSLGMRVYEKSFYGPPNCIPWIEFLGIATIIAKHHQNFHLYHNDDVYITTMICVDISRLRRWLRCKLRHDGFRRNHAHWSQCWHIINIDKTDMEFDIYIPKESVFKKGAENFVFEPEPELVLPLYGDLNSKYSFPEDVDVEMAGTTEGAVEDNWARLLDPRLPGVSETSGMEGGEEGGEMESPERAKPLVAGLGGWALKRTTTKPFAAESDYEKLALRAQWLRGGRFSV